MNFLTDINFKEATQHVTGKLPVAIYRNKLIKDRGDGIRLHWHKEFQLVWVLEGKFSYQVGREKIYLDEDKLLFINSGRLHQAKVLTEEVEYICVDFSPYFFNDILYQNFLKELMQEEQADFQVVLRDPKWDKRLRELHTKPVDENFLSLTIFLLEFIEKVFQKKTVETKQSEAFIYPLLNYVHQHYIEDISVDVLSQRGHMNKNKCTELFKLYTGYSPKNYVIYYRLFIAKEKLLTTNQTISEICYSVGFNHLSYFIEAFKKKYHFTPLQFRKNYQ
ncbi:helix-turn-helix domain-containing protein [Enterococcus alishanensis]|uniref:AraC family transcriptional regulator n=1 Tax=Enterococcus alishanensis TaxID=1303817 RepID=A0ABS6TDC7_9ENTE|nr:AraC family transcriptional regulator [Enterococcus alishanensis]MBV7390934.1 AraC family transcriptional regulator [Enterococcus alishanensis]